MDDGEGPAGLTDGAAPAGTVGGLRLVEKMPIAILHKREILEKLAALGQPVLLLGECDKLAREALPANVRLVAPHLRLPRAGAVGLAADNPLCVFGTELAEMVPFYFRRSEAEELWEKRHPEAKQNPVEQVEITPCVHP